MSTDAIDLLIEDHRKIRGLFKEFQDAGADANRKGQIVDQILEALTVHTYVENECMYPETRRLCPDLNEAVLESYEEHHVADVLGFELAMMSPDDEHFEAKTMVLIEAVNHHIQEEENEWFPKVRAGLSRDQLQGLGAKLAELMKKAPRKPTAPRALKKAMDAVRA
ncbi:hemerythrin domain-containing protein [Micromonospora deserti]|uniref:Hemerythrin n=1 Tax=Micromonospora deserti TaxID=2070366 RepID=A0A2W2CXF6_9ACTN|nr:hemerythrin domain-containing protein [Micromonospora deserti]PZG02611.1 hemerythrin [Micromonospora deserti]